MVRVILHQVLVLVLSVVFALILGGLLQWFLGGSFSDAFLVESPRLLFTFMDVGLVVWMILLIVGGFRRRGLGWGTVGTALAALIAAVVNLVVVSVIAIAGGGAEIFYIVIGVEAGAVFVIGALLAIVLSRRLIAV